MSKQGKLIFFAGKMGSGKSTLSKEIACTSNAVLISEDEWMSKLYPNEIENFNDYITYSKRLKSVLVDHIIGLLRQTNTVVLDFPANTKKQREWFLTIIEEAKCEHILFYLKAENNICLSRLKKRRIEQPNRQHFDTKEVFNQVTAYFEEPNEEWFCIETIVQK